MTSFNLRQHCNKFTAKQGMRESHKVHQIGFSTRCHLLEFRLAKMTENFKNIMAELKVELTNSIGAKHPGVKIQGAPCIVWVLTVSFSRFWYKERYLSSLFWYQEKI